MRKVIFMAAVCSVMAMFALSCGKESTNPAETNNNQPEEPQEEVKMVDVTLTAGVAETKVFSSGNTLKWNSGNKNDIAVFADVNGSIVRYKFNGDAGSSSTTSLDFTGSVAEGAVLKYASYSYSEERTCVNDVLALRIADNQYCDANNSIPHNTPLYGIISGTNVTMKAPCAFLKVTLPQSTDSQTLTVYNKVNVSAANAFGDFTVDCSGATPVVSAGNTNEVNVSVRKNQSGTMYVPILPGTYNNITITVYYNDGHANFSRTSTTSQTFESGYAYDCHEVAGPYVESVTTGAGSVVEETTLSMSASAVLWKYAGVTNSDYTFKFFYAPHGTAKDASGWTEVAASSVSGDGTAVAFSASATVAVGAYDFYAQVSDGSVTIDGDIEAAVAMGITQVVWNFADIAAGTGSYVAPGDAALSTPTFTYNNNVANRKMITDDSGNPVFPTFSITPSKANYYYKNWDGSAWGTNTQVTNGSASDINGMLGGSTTIVVDGDTYTLTINQTAKYYTFSSSKLCSQKGFNMRMICPDGFTIKRVVLSTASGDTCNWGIGTNGSSADKVAGTAYSGGAADITIPSPVTGQDLYLISNANASRLQVLTVYYEH